jgi:toxin ParE1/3/4
MRVRWTKPATYDLTKICDYIEEHSSLAIARRAALSIHERAGALTDFAERGRPGRIPGTRELIFSGLPYLAVYRVNNDAVEILRILHGAQEWP